MNRIMTKQLNNGYNIQKPSARLQQGPVAKVSVLKRIWNWLKSKFSRFGKRADELTDRVIDRGTDKIFDEIEKKVEPLL